MKIRTRLLVTYLLLTVLGMVLLGAHHWWSFNTFFRRTAQADLAARSLALCDGVRDALEAGDLQRVHSLVQVNGLQQGIKVRVIGADGKLVASSAPEKEPARLKDWTSVPGVALALQNQTAAGIARGRLTCGDRFYDARPIQRDGHLLGVLRFSLTLDQFQSELRASLLAQLATGIAASLLCALASICLARGIAQPIQAMSAFAGRVGGGRFGDELELDRPDELGQLARELTRMSHRLAALDTERRSFLANVAHELRTPVTNVEVTLEALAGGADAEPHQRAIFIRAAQNELARLRDLVQDLLGLGRLEAGVADLEIVPVRLCQQVEASLAAMGPRLQAAEIRVRTQVPDVVLQADPHRLAQVLINLLDNTLKHSPRGSTVHISARVRDDRIRIRVEDQGPGIADEDLPRVFDAFFVGDRSRAGTSTGLGLTIARRIVEAHGGSLTAESTPGRGAAFVVELPLSQSPATVLAPTGGESAPRPAAPVPPRVELDMSPGGTPAALAGGGGG